MPVSFEPMADVSGAQNYGAALARQADREFALKAQGQANEQSARMSALSQADEHFQAQLADQRARSIMGEQGQMARQESAQSHQEQMARLQADLDSNKLNHVEQIRMQRLQSQAAYIDSQTGPEGSGKQFTPEMGNAMKTQIMTELNPYLVRTQRSHAQQAELGRQQMGDYNAWQTTLANMGTESTVGGAVQNPQFEIRDSNGNLTHRLIPDGTGRLHPLDVRDPNSQRIEEARRAHIAGRIQHIEDRVAAELRDWRDPVNRPNAPAWTQTQEGIDAQIEARIRRAQAQTDRIFGATGSQQGRVGPGGTPQGANEGTGEGGPQAVQVGSQVIPAEGRVPLPPLRERAIPSGTPMDRIRILEQIANAITPGPGGFRSSANAPTILSAGNEAESAPARRMREIITAAGRENRDLTRGEATHYLNAQRELATVNPEAARLYSLTPTPEQNAFGHSEERASQLQTLVPELRDEAGRIFNSTGRIGRLTNSSGVQHVGQMFEILDKAAKANRRLSAEETSQYLAQWRALRRINSPQASEWADSLALHQQ